MVGRTRAALAALSLGASLTAGTAAWASDGPENVPVAGQAGWIAGASTNSLSAFQHVAVATADAGPDGTTGWVSAAYMAEHPSFLTGLTTSAATPITPDSHFGCNKSVCIDVRGSGLKVDHWFTTANGGYGKCTHAFFDIYHPGNPVSGHNPSRTISGPRICSGDSNGVFYDYVTDPNGNYSDHTWLCNGWTQSIIVGYPCAEVHS